MAEFADVARPTLYKLVADLQCEDILTFTRSVGDSRFYRLNVANPRIVSMLQMDFEGINKERASGAYGEMPDSPKEPAKSQAGSRSRGRTPWSDPSATRGRTRAASSTAWCG